jgi:hypothetical protein
VSDNFGSSREDRALLWGKRDGLFSVLERLPALRNYKGQADPWAQLQEWLEARIVIDTRMLEQSKRLGRITEAPEPAAVSETKVLHILKCIETNPRLRRHLAEYMATCSDVHEAEVMMAAAVRLAPLDSGADTPPLEDPHT